jgi:hypothetical protein
MPASQGTRETIEIAHMINISMYHLTALTLQSPGFGNDGGVDGPGDQVSKGGLLL